mgnify:CR=1 FL=1
MNVRLPKTVNELYTMVDKCARAEEGRRLQREEVGVEVDSEDDDVTIPRKRNRKRNNKCKEKSVIGVESASVKIGGSRVGVLNCASKADGNRIRGTRCLPRFGPSLWR